MMRCLAEHAAVRDAAGDVVRDRGGGRSDSEVVNASTSGCVASAMRPDQAFFERARLAGMGG